MAEYDPFSSGNSLGGSSNFSYKKKKKIDYIKYIKQALPIVIIGVILFIIVKLLFFNSCIVEADIKNTEGLSIPQAEIIFTKPGNPQDKEAFNVFDEIKIKKGTYNYKIRADEYNLISEENVEITDDTYVITKILEKNIKLNILGMSFPTQIFNNTEIISQIDIENKSTTQSYTAEHIIIEGDEDYEFYFSDNLGNIKDANQIIIQPKERKSIFIKIIINEDLKIGDKYTLTPRIKYRKLDNDYKKEFTILEKPKVNITFKNTSGELIIGKQNKYTINYTIDNSKNDLLINDLLIDLNVESIENKDLNVETWFDYPKNNILVEKKKRHEGLIEIYVPNQAKPETITGEFIISSKSILEEDIIEPIELTLNEPDIDYKIDFEEKITLDYDVNNNMTNIEYLDLTITNRNDFTLTIKDLQTRSISTTKDCNKFIYIAPDFIRSIYKDNSIDIPIEINGNIDSSYMQNLDLQNPQALTRRCEVKIIFDHPFREDQSLEEAKNITIELNVIE